MLEMTKRENLEIQSLDTFSLTLLQEKKDAAEKEKRNQFEDFSDIEMLAWYIHEQKHTNKENERANRTKKEYEGELSRFINHLLVHSEAIGVDISEIREQSLFKSLESRHLRRYQEWLVNDSPHVLERGPYSQSTISRKTTILKSFFRYLYRVRYIDEDIAQGLRQATVRKDDRPNRDLGPQDVVAVLRAFREINHPVMFSIVLVLTATGIRNEEFCRLKIEDVKNDPILGGYYLDVIGKGNKKRQIPLKKKVYDSIRMFRYARGLPSLSEAAPTAPLFTTSRGTAFKPTYLIAYMNKQIQKVQEELGNIEVELTPHVFRHAFAITSRLNKVDVFDIMRSLGHEKLETTQIYLEKVFSRELHAVNQWSADALDEFL